MAPFSKSRPREKKSGSPTASPAPAFFSGDFYWLWAIFFLSFLGFLTTLCPCFMDDDSPETITAGVTLGLAHPPGYPLDALVNRLLSLVPLGDPGFRVNWGSALFAAFGALLAALNLKLLVVKFFPGRGETKNLGPWLASAGLFLAFSKTYWEKAVSAKGGLYITEMLFLMATLFCLLKLESPDSGKGPREKWALLVFFLTGLALAHYWETQVIFMPGLVLFFALREGGLLGTAAFWTRTFRRLSLAAVGLSVFALYLPLRAQLHPVLNLGDPRTWTLFKLTARRAYVAGSEPVLPEKIWEALRGAIPWSQVHTLWFQITHLQNVEISVHLWTDIGWVGLLLSAAGLFAWWRRGARGSLLFLAVSGACLLLVFYTILIIPLDVRNRWYLDNFLLPSNWALAILAGLGLWVLRPHLTGSIPRRVLGAALLVFLPLQQWLLNHAVSDEQNQMLRYDYGENLMKSAPRNAIFFSEGDEDFFPLYYFQNVAHQRPDLRVIPPFTLFETWGVEEVEYFHPELGLTAAQVDFPDHFARIIYSLSEIVAKNRDKDVCAFSYLPGALHKYYCDLRPRLTARRSGIALWLNYPAARRARPLDPSQLRTRHWEDCPSNAHFSMMRIAWVYEQVGLLKLNASP
ncbi:MAG TPA: DUF2723 domain-containing protein [bacterium]|nr:DUF2723 domain-containing protein [bacterium]